eukprot:TRINITY_DN3516_c1_g1_i1.p2 TRINITY_DN3516_c1_g1~~TRINITY_DN3516_c1_g1_i1.p2  ORF type:complete len:396 (+),score=66.96 TRINITY_DN3516_c1_g1_i1:2136-3323(+)
MVERIEAFHSKGLIHRDVKPENFTIGRNENCTTAYIIDYGLAKRYRNPRTKMHIPYKQNKKLTGTARYSSINTHMGIEQSRRDDIECLGYTFIYMAKGELPWQGIKAETKKEKYEKILERKSDVSIDYLCKGLPIEFTTYMYYCRTLQFEDKPDYGQLKKLFKECFYKGRYDRGFILDWIKRGVDLNNYDKKEAGKKAKKNDKNKDGSSNKADYEKNDEDAIMRAKSREVKKSGLEERKVSKKAVHLEVVEENVEHKKSLAKSEAIKKRQECKYANDEVENSPLLQTPEKSAEDTPPPRKFQQEGVKEFPIMEDEIKRQRKLEVEKLAKGFPQSLSKIIEEEKKTKTEMIKGIPIHLYRKITKEFSEHSSCNFKIPDIIENYELFGIFLLRLLHR